MAMSDLLSIIRARLVALGVVDGTTWKCFIGYGPDIQDQLISLHLTGGWPQDTHQNENVHQTFQVRVRTARLDYAVCEAKWWAMYDALHDADLSANGINFIQAMASGPLEYLDAENRVNMTANFTVIREKT